MKSQVLKSTKPHSHEYKFDQQELNHIFRYVVLIFTIRLV